MGVYKPKVQCRGTFGTSDSCKHVLADMQATANLEVFGPPNAPHVKEELPLEIVSGKVSAMSRAGSSLS